MWLVRGSSDASVPGEAPRAPSVSARIYRALGTRSWDTALRLVEENWTRLIAEDVSAIRAVVETVPVERLEADPRWPRARAYLLTIPTKSAPPRVGPGGERVDEVLRLTSAARGARTAEDHAEALRLVRAARDAYESASAHRRGALADDLPQLLLTWGLTEALGGDGGAAVDHLVRAYSTARSTGAPRIALAAASELAWQHAMEGRSDARDDWMAAARLLLPAGEMQPHAPVSLLLAHAIAAYDANDLPAAHRLLEAAWDDRGERAVEISTLQAFVDAKDPAADPFAHVARLESASLAHLIDDRRGRLDAARACALLHTGHGEQARRLLEEVAVPVLPSIRALRASAHLVQGDLDRALRDAHASLHELGRPRGVVEAAAVIAAVHLRRRDGETAAAFRRAVTLADTHRLPLALANLPAGDFAALAPFAPSGSPSMSVLERAPVRRPSVPPLSGVRATEQELAVLRLLAGDRSIAQAAAVLGVSPNTVKTLARRIYAKLGVSDRRQMLLAAQEHGLL